MKSVWQIYLKPILIVALAFVAMNFCASPMKSVVDRISLRGVNEASLKASLGKGVLFGVLGGYRSLISDFVWIKSFLEWERKDASACVASIELATAIDPYMITFWVQGAAIIAYDIPHWNYQKLSPDLREPSALSAFKKKGAKSACIYLDKALRMFPNNVELLMEKGQIAMNNGDNYPLAEECYAKAVAQPDSPIYMRRTYAHILYKNGKFRKCLDVLSGIYKDAEEDSPVRPIVLNQMEELKKLIKKTEQ